MKFLFLAFLIVLVAAGGLTAWASPPEEMDEVGEAPGPRNASDAVLVGTALVEGWVSLAVFQVAGGTRVVKEGDEIVRGLHLVRVRMNRIDVERNGVHEEIRLGYSEGNRQQARPARMRGATTQGGLESLWVSPKEKVQYRRELIARQRSQNSK